MMRFDRLKTLILSIAPALLFAASVLWGGCGGGNSVGSAGGSVASAPPTSPLQFDGVATIDVLAGTAVKVNWAHHAGAVMYLVYDVTSGAAVYKGSAFPPATNLTLTGLTPEMNYKFRVRLLDSNGLQDGNTHDVSALTGPDACYQQEVLADGPVIYFPMNETSGSSPTDLGSLGFGGLSWSGTFLVGQPSAIISETSYSVDLDGSTGHLDLGNPAELQITGDQTIEMWIKPASFTARRNPYAKAYGGEGTITLEPSRQLNYYYGTSGANTPPYQGFNSAGTVSATGWTHIAVVRDLTNMRLYWYINGAQSSTAAASYAAAAVSSMPALIGKGYVNNFDGLIEDVAVYDKALPAARIQAHYDASSACP